VIGRAVVRHLELEGVDEVDVGYGVSHEGIIHVLSRARRTRTAS
jgi:hypothetical protein